MSAPSLAVPEEFTRSRETLGDRLCDIELTLASLASLDPQSERFAEDKAILESNLEADIIGAKEKADAVAAVFVHLDENDAVLAHEVERLKARMGRNAAKRERLQNYILFLLESRGEAELRGWTSEIKIKTNPAKVDIIDASLIPYEFMRTPPTPPTPPTPGEQPDKVAIKKELAAGGLVPGARLIRDRKLEVS